MNFKSYRKEIEKQHGRVPNLNYLRELGEACGGVARRASRPSSISHQSTKGSQKVAQQGNNAQLPIACVADTFLSHGAAPGEY